MYSAVIVTMPLHHYVVAAVTSTLTLLPALRRRLTQQPASWELTSDWLVIMLGGRQNDSVKCNLRLLYQNNVKDERETNGKAKVYHQ